MAVSARPTTTRLLLATGLPLCMMLAACGGGSGGGINSPPPAAPPPPVVPPPPPPPPPPPSPPVDTTTQEFTNSAGIAHANAASAYQAGATGRGITAAVIDSGIDTVSAEFAGRISAASQDVAGNRGVKDTSGHGTAVTAVIAAARNNANIVGMAFDATILSLRTDEPGSCARTGEDEGCAHLTSDIARAIDIAVANNARVINISLGGSAASSSLRAAIGRASRAGVVVVISAGNDSEANPDPLAQVALTSEANGLVIIAGSVGANDALSDFSNMAGIAQNVYITALGERVRSFDHEAKNFLYSGTSFSAPQVSGAVALLAQAFPNLTGRQIVQLLFRSARDGGAAGDDVVYGQGILDLAEAFRPQGQTVLAGNRLPIGALANASLSAPMGDARQAGAGAVILDGFDRAFAIDLAATVRRTPAPRQLANALDHRGGGQFLAPAGSNAVVAVTIDADTGFAMPAPLALRGEDAERARVAAGLIAARIGRDTSVAFAFSQSGDSVGAQLAGRSRPAFLVAREAGGQTGFASRPGNSIALRRRIGDVAVTLFGEAGAVVARNDSARALADDPWLRSRYAALGVGLDRNWGRWRLDGSLSWIDEDETFLGARFAPALGGGAGAQSLFADLGVSYLAGGGWSFGAEFRHGWSAARTLGGVLESGQLRSFAASADVSKSGVFSAIDRLSLRIAQPLRVYRGGLDLTLPVSYDYATLSPGYESSFFNLAPQGRQIDTEAAYATPLGGGWLTGHLFYRRDPGHYSTISDDMGAAIRYTLGF